MLVVLDPSTCPACGARIALETTWQGALFIACGYGATERKTTRWCPCCGWWMLHETTEVRP